ESFWWSERVAGRPHELFLTSSSGQTIALGFPGPDWSDAASELIRFTALAVLCGVLVLALQSILLLPAGELLRLVAGLAARVNASYAQRLLVALLVAALLPLVALSLTLRGAVAREARETVQSGALASLESARRLLADYHATAGEGARADYASSG